MEISVNSIFFITYSIILILASILSILSKKMIYTLLFALLVFIMTGGLFILLGATYNAMVQFLIYVIAIPVLIAISIMVLNQRTVFENIKLKDIIWFLFAVLVLGTIICEFLIHNKETFNATKHYSVYVNQYSDLISISMNILGTYPVLFLEFGLAILLIVIGVLYYEK